MTAFELRAKVKPFRPKDRTAAERKRRSRARQRKRRVTPVTTMPVTAPVTLTTMSGHGRDPQHIDDAPQLGRSIAVRNAARDAASVTAPENSYLALMVLNAVGAFGFLSWSHMEHAVAGDVLAVAGKVDIDARLAVHASTVNDLDRRIAQDRRCR